MAKCIRCGAAIDRPQVGQEGAGTGVTQGPSAAGTEHRRLVSRSALLCARCRQRELLTDIAKWALLALVFAALAVLLLKPELIFPPRP